MTHELDHAIRRERLDDLRELLVQARTERTALRAMLEQAGSAADKLARTQQALMRDVPLLDEIVLIDDLATDDPVYVRDLPKPKKQALAGSQPEFEVVDVSGLTSVALVRV